MGFSDSIAITLARCGQVLKRANRVTARARYDAPVAKRTPYLRRRVSTARPRSDEPWWRSQALAAFLAVVATIFVGGLAWASAERNF